MISLKGKWVLITGAYRGIGRLAALAMADQGCNLVLHRRRLDHTETLLEDVRAKPTQSRRSFPIWMRLRRCLQRSTPAAHRLTLC